MQETFAQREAEREKRRKEDAVRMMKFVLKMMICIKNDECFNSK